MTERDTTEAQLAAAIEARNNNSDAVTLLALKSLGLSIRGRTSARFIDLTEGDQGDHDVVFDALVDAEGNDLDDGLNDNEQDLVMQLEDWRLNDLLGPEEAPTFVTVRFSARTPYWRVDLAAASELTAGDEPSRVILVDGEPRSSCCQAEIEITVDYTDTHVFLVTSADTDEDGNLVGVRYQRVKTYDGLDGEGRSVHCRKCEKPVDEGDLEFDEVG